MSRRPDPLSGRLDLLTGSETRTILLQLLEVSQAQAILPMCAEAVHLQQVISCAECNGCHAELRSGLAQKLENVFDTFFTTKPHGTGLGLSIARTIIANYSDRIWAKNKHSGGAVFRFILPLAKAHTALSVSPQATSQRQSPPVLCFDCPKGLHRMTYKGTGIADRHLTVEAGSQFQRQSYQSTHLGAGCRSAELGHRSDGAHF
jgi:hypothetical protein